LYESLRGNLDERTAASLALDVGGVVYALAIPPGLPFPGAAVGSELRVWTHLHVREDAHTLFGFPDRATRDLFRVLLKVRGVGPTMALGILSGLARQELVEAIVQQDTGLLVRVKGVGKKTAEQILLDLRDRTGLLTEAGANVPQVEVPRPKAGPDQANIEDAVQALVSVGYSEKDGRKRVEQAADSVDASDLEQLVRVALRG